MAHAALGGEPPPAEEAREAEPEVKEELYPDTDRQGPIGARDPETAGQETQAMEPPFPAKASGAIAKGKVRRLARDGAAGPVARPLPRRTERLRRARPGAPARARPQGRPGRRPQLVEALGAAALALDIPALTYGIDSGEEPTPFQVAQDLAAEAWGAKRTWFLVNGASAGNHVALLTLAHAGKGVIAQRNAHSSTIDGCILAGLSPVFVAPEVDPELGIAHCITPETLERALADNPGRGGRHRSSRPPTSAPWPTWPALAEVAHAHGVPLVVDESWGAHLAFHPDLPAHALSLGADLVVSSTHKIVGSLTQSAMVHLGHDAQERIDEHVVDRCVTLVESTSPSALLAGSLDAARRLAATRGRELLDETLQALAAIREAVRGIEGLDVLDERLAGAPGVHDYDPMRLAIDVRGTGVDGYELAALLRDRADISLELAGENVIVGVFGMADRVAEQGRGWWPRCAR